MSVVKFIAINILFFSVAVKCDVVLGATLLSAALNKSDLIKLPTLNSTHFFALQKAHNKAWNQTNPSPTRLMDESARLGSRFPKIYPTATRQINPKFNTRGPGPAFDGDMRTSAKVVLGTSSVSHGDEIWWQAEFNTVYFFDTLTLHSFYYTSWFDKSWGCVENTEMYQFCKDEMSYVDIDVYYGSRFVARCGTLVQGHGLRRQDQIYSFNCGSTGDRITLSKRHSKTMLVLPEIVITGQKPSAPKPLTITGAELNQPKKIGRRKYSKAEDCINDMSTFAQLAASRNWVTVTLRKRAQITKVELYAPIDTPETALTTMENANIYVATPRDVYCGIADGSTKIPVMFGGTERVRYVVNCKQYQNALKLVGDAVKIQSSSVNMKVARVVVFGVELADDTQEFELEEREFRTAKEMQPTIAPYNDERNEILAEPKFKTTSEGVEVVEISIKEDVPYKVIENIAEQKNATKTPLGYLAFAGYVDYSLDEDTEEPEEVDPSVRERTTFNNDNLQTAIQSFLRFNGYVEDGEISKDMVEFMQKDRCGNADLVSNPNGDKCTTQKSLLIKPAVTNTVAFAMPGDKESADIVAEAESYYLELDIKFNDVRNGRSRSIFLGFNYDELNANGHETPLEVVALRFMRKKLCVQFLTVLDGQFLTPLVSTKTVLESCYTPSEEEEKTFSFKARLDVYKHIGGLLEKVAISIRGKEIAANVHKTPLFSSVAIMHRDDHSITLARLCKRWNLSSGYTKPKRSQTRRKRFTLSNHKWGIAEQTMRYNFQNYSTHLGADGTRQGVLKALNLYSQSVGFNFQEVLPTATAEIVFMFIRGRHADGQTFHGAGVEKAHAYSPTHSEIHFNDHQTFSMEDGDKKTSIFYVATHEIGHALGLLHSQQEDAVMQPGYPSNAFTFRELHDDDIRAAQTLYPELSGVGAIEKLRAVEGDHTYTPKSPYPTECHSQIDAALLIRDFAYIISGPFIWRMRRIGDEWEPFDNYPKRVTDVFQQTYGRVEALFKVQSGDDITIFALFAGDMISKYRIFPKDGNAEPVVLLKDAKTKRRDFLRGEDGIVIDENIRSAFTYNDKTILVSENLERYYEVSWTFNKKGVLKGVSAITSNSEMNNLIGRKLQKVHFNAAMTIDINIAGESQKMVYMFGASYVHLERPFPSNPTKSKYWYKVPKHFIVAGWCPARNTS